MSFGGSFLVEVAYFLKNFCSLFVPGVGAEISVVVVWVVAVFIAMQSVHAFLLTVE